MIGSAAMAAMAGMVLVRLGWAGRAAVAASGWILALAALVVLALMAGAWAVSVGTVAGMVTALGALAWSAWLAPVRVQRPERERVATPPMRKPIGWARRASVFLLVVPVGGIAALWLSFATQAAARRAGMGTADTSAWLLLLLPCLWCGLLTWQMTRQGPRQMIAAPLLAIAAGTVLWTLR